MRRLSCSYPVLGLPPFLQVPFIHTVPYLVKLTEPKVPALHIPTPSKFCVIGPVILPLPLDGEHVSVIANWELLFQI